MYRGALFARFARRSARVMGHPIAFMVAVLSILGWALTGPTFHFSDTWQLVINTGTSIVTFLMVFLIQNAQNRDSAEIQIKLDELIRAIEGADNALLDLEGLSEHELDQIRLPYAELARRARKDLQQGVREMDAPDVQTG